MYGPEPKKPEEKKPELPQPPTDDEIERMANWTAIRSYPRSVRNHRQTIVITVLLAAIGLLGSYLITRFVTPAGSQPAALPPLAIQSEPNKKAEPPEPPKQTDKPVAVLPRVKAEDKEPKPSVEPKPPAPIALVQPQPVLTEKQVLAQEYPLYCPKHGDVIYKTGREILEHDKHKFPCGSVCDAQQLRAARDRVMSDRLAARSMRRLAN